MSDEAAKNPTDGTVISFEDVFAAEDGRQFIISTTENPIFARNVTGAARAGQCLGKMSDNTAQQISQDFSHTATTPATTSQSDSDGQFDVRHGKGRAIGSEKTVGNRSVGS